MNSTLEVTNLKLIGKLQSRISLKGTIQNNTIRLVGKLQQNQSPYYATANDYGTTIYIG